MHSFSTNIFPDKMSTMLFNFMHYCEDEVFLFI